MAAFEEFYLATERIMYAYLLSLLKRPEDTLDAVQDTFLRIRIAASRYQPMGKPLAWMFTIARNLAMDCLKQKQRETVLEKTAAVAGFGQEAAMTDQLVLSEALTVLGEEERQILLLHAAAGLKHREIAQGLGVSLSTVLSRYHRAKLKLKKKLKEQGVSL